LEQAYITISMKKAQQTFSIKFQ